MSKKNGENHYVLRMALNGAARPFLSRSRYFPFEMVALDFSRTTRGGYAGQVSVLTTRCSREENMTARSSV